MSNSRSDSNEEQLKKLLKVMRDKALTVMKGGGAKKIEEQHQKGKLTARERIQYLLDKGAPFIEIGLFAGEGMYAEQGG